MKKLILLFMPLLFVLTASCQKDKDMAKEISGSYVYTLNGSISMTLLGNPVTLPVIDAGTAVITSSGGNEVSIISDDFSSNGTIKGDKIKFDKFSRTETDDEVTMNMTLESEGTISGGTITITSKISGNATTTDINVPIQGASSIVLTKI